MGLLACGYRSHITIFPSPSPKRKHIYTNWSNQRHSTFLEKRNYYYTCQVCVTIYLYYELSSSVRSHNLENNDNAIGTLYIIYDPCETLGERGWQVQKAKLFPIVML